MLGRSLALTTCTSCHTSVVQGHWPVQARFKSTPCSVRRCTGVVEQHAGSLAGCSETHRAALIMMGLWHTRWFVVGVATSEDLCTGLDLFLQCQGGEGFVCCPNNLCWGILHPQTVVC
jgi:hypothetical protein